MNFSKFNTSTLLSNMDRLDKDLIRLSLYSNTSSDDLIVKIISAKRDVCSLIIEGAESDLVCNMLGNLRYMGCDPAVDSFIKNKKWG